MIWQAKPRHFVIHKGAWWEVQTPEIDGRGRFVLIAGSFAEACEMAHEWNRRAPRGLSYRAYLARWDFMKALCAEFRARREERAAMARERIA